MCAFFLFLRRGLFLLPQVKFLSLSFFVFFFVFLLFFFVVSPALFFCFVLFFFFQASTANNRFLAKQLDFGKTTGIKEHDDDSKYVILILILSAHAKGAKKMSDETRRLASSLSSSSSSSSSSSYDDDDENNNNKKEEKSAMMKMKESTNFERRLRETQKTLVKERRQREITEAVLEETTRALDSVRRASIVLAAGAASSKTTNNGGNGSNTNVQPASASSSVKFMTVGRTLKILSNGGKGAEETIEDLLSEIERLRNELETTSLKYDEQDAELAATKQQLRAKEAYIKDRRQNVVELKMDIREVTSDEQIEFIDKTREVLKAAVHSSLQIEQLKKMDRKRTQALAKLVEHMQMQRDALQLKLNDLGFKDTSEDDAIHEAMIAKKFHNANDGGKEEPVKTPSGKTFYVTRIKSSLYERLFGIHI
jgi:hypothetical protein